MWAITLDCLSCLLASLVNVNRKAVCILFVGNSNVGDLSPFARYSQSKCAWPWHLETANVKCKYANRKDIYVISYLLVIAMFGLSVAICEKFKSRELLDLDLYNEPWSNVSERCRWGCRMHVLLLPSFIDNLHVFMNFLIFHERCSG